MKVALEKSLSFDNCYSSTYLYVQLFQKEGSDGVWKSVRTDSELYDGIKDQDQGSGGWLLRRVWAGGTAPSPSSPPAPPSSPWQNQRAAAETARLLSLIFSNGKLKVASLGFPLLPPHISSQPSWSEAAKQFQSIEHRQLQKSAWVPHLQQPKAQKCQTWKR